MIAYANTTISIFRDTASDNAFDDDVASPRPVHSKVPASVLENTRYVATRDQDTPLVVRYVTGRVSYGTDVQEGDRIYDERAKTWYSISSLSNTGNPVVRMDIRMEMKRVT